MVSVSEAILIVIGGIFIYNVVFIWRKRNFYKFAWKSKTFPLPVLPVLGNIYTILLVGSYDTVSPLSYIRTLAKWFGHPIDFWFGRNYIYVTKNPLEIKVVLNHIQCLEKGETSEFINCLYKDSLLTAPYDIWKPKRRYLQSSFKPSVIKSFVPTTYEASCKLVENIKLMKNMENLVHFFFQYTFKNFFMTSAGLKEENYCSDFNEIGEIIARLEEYASAGMFAYPFVSTEFLLQYTPIGKRCSRDLTAARDTIYKLVVQKRRDNQRTPINFEKDVPLFDLLMNDNSGKLTLQQIFEETILFTGAATDTTGVTLSFCFTLLGMNPEIQEVLYKEVIGHVGKNVITNEDLHNLKYTEAVILESLRIFPAAPMLVRVARADVVLENNTIPEGTNVLIDIFHLHRDEQHWPNPLKFDPSRFLPENAANIKPYTFIPFGAGPRDCIGKAQAMMVMKITLANIVRNFKIVSKHKSTDEFTLLSAMCLRPKGSLDCRFLPR